MELLVSLQPWKGVRSGFSVCIWDRWRGGHHEGRGVHGSWRHISGWGACATWRVHQWALERRYGNRHGEGDGSGACAIGRERDGSGANCRGDGASGARMAMGAQQGVARHE